MGHVMRRRRRMCDKNCRAEEIFVDKHFVNEVRDFNRMHNMMLVVSGCESISEMYVDGMESDM
jgi:hypothetical protein